MSVFETFFILNVSHWHFSHFVFKCRKTFLLRRVLGLVDLKFNFVANFEVDCF